MKNDIPSYENNHPSNAFNNVLEESLREGARKLLKQAIDNEVSEHLEKYMHLREDNNTRAVIRNGYLPKRRIQTGIAPSERSKASAISEIVHPLS